MDKLITKTSKLGRSKQPVVLEVQPEAEEKVKLLLLDKILSTKTCSRLVVKDIISKVWNTINEVEVSVMDKNVFMFSFNHEVDMRRVWDRRPWSFKGDHVILKKYDPDLSFNEVDFSFSDYWIQILGLPLNRQHDSSLQKIETIIGSFVETDLSGSGGGGGCHFVRVRVGFEINRPLPTGFPLDQGKLPALWIPFKFERLGNFCYGCGILGHDIKS